MVIPGRDGDRVGQGQRQQELRGCAGTDVRGAPRENRAKQQRRGRAGHAARDVGNHSPVITRVKRRHVGDGQRDIGPPNDVAAVELPLIAQGRTAGLDTEDRFHSRRDIQALRLCGNRGGLSSRMVSACGNQPENQPRYTAKDSADPAMAGFL